MSGRFSLAIDLGTSNSAIAIADLESGETRIIEIAQTLGPNQIGEMADTAVRHLYSALRGVPGEFVSSALERCRGARDHWPVRARAGGARA